MPRRWLWAAGIAAVMISGCGSGDGRGFSLPEGDAGRGEAAFLALGCNHCHTIAGREAPAQPEAPELSLPLGGEVSHINTYGELVTSIINPSHRLSRRFPPGLETTDGHSRMPSYNQVMTVEQLIDLVTFLHDQYEIAPYEHTNYPAYL
jgi:L-cysteine S-thiosulfotransferase